ncbi:vanadium-dependent haloperoxidase [Mucilaginibacter roseus]|uniref:Vanadium-dependent haloperoxidase n=1 Tax=Mucilaginibacter roseus TaxID=1528868 RepID=A0ABS8U8B5_9SPHI|nr:vanadium-dependent haloperoxidase [Mucilaginibacter roseus]MCD8742209.1 vanadium-dependent haloperoxidase [Mucilaginibacter roseus]
MKRILQRLVFVTALFTAATGKAQQRGNDFPDYMWPGHALHNVSMVMVHDVVSPPVAARYYAYCMLGAYNIVSVHNKSNPQLNKLIKSYSPTHRIDTVKAVYDYRIASYYSILETAKLMLPSGFLIKDDQDAFITQVKKTGIKQDIINNSIKVGQQAAVDAVNFSKGDRYNKLSALKRYTPLQGEGYWYPTPPGYFEAVEPNWRTIRTMVLDTATQCKPAPLTPFSKDSTSAFYKQVKEVYQASKKLTDEQINQALFWDCNPFAITTSGHMSIGYKKISPGGHWMHITALVSKQAKLTFDETISLLTLEGLTLMDSFIACWEEKFATNRIRPETFINRYMDVKWQPILQTPPFPEYTSGHSVVSAASAEVLTYMLGDNFKYDDDTEIPFGSGKRSFNSFRQAADEAGMSRFYGGIHYIESIETGNTQGKNVAGYIIARMKEAGVKPCIKQGK